MSTPYYNLNILEDNSNFKIFTSLIPEHTDDFELKWHRDNGDRYITVQSGLNWKLQLDNQLPINLEINQSYFIPFNSWHRVIKGNQDLILSIKEYPKSLPS
jgi:hypothetical protein